MDECKLLTFYINYVEIINYINKLNEKMRNFFNYFFAYLYGLGLGALLAFVLIGHLANEILNWFTSIFERS